MVESERAPAQVGIAIVNYRTADLLTGLFERWAADKASLRRIGKVAVVDNDPGYLNPDGWPSSLPLEYVSLGRNAGYATGVNRAWEMLSTEYVLLLNPDADIGLEAIQQMADLLDSHPRAGALAPLHVDFNGAPSNPYHTLPSWLDLAAHGTHLFRFAWAKRRTKAYRCDWLDGIGPGWPMTSVEQPPASCLLVRRAALGVSPMDERFPIFFNDVDLSMQLKAGNWETLVAPQIIFRHVPATSTRYLGIRNRAEGYLGAYRYLRKWEGPGRSNLYRLLLVSSLAVSARERELRAENLEAIRAVLTNRSVFEMSHSADPVRAYWPTET
jgi:GT2 family glycosyltransferase